MLGTRLAATSCPVFGYCPPKDLSKAPAQPRLVCRAVPQTCLAWRPVSSLWAVLHLPALARQCHDRLLTDSSLQLTDSVPCAPHTGEAAESSASTSPKQWSAGGRQAGLHSTARRRLGGGLVSRTLGMMGRGSLKGVTGQVVQMPPLPPGRAARLGWTGWVFTRPVCPLPRPGVLHSKAMLQPLHLPPRVAHCTSDENPKSLSRESSNVSLNPQRCCECSPHFPDKDN